jgi:hypothetical protein
MKSLALSVLVAASLSLAASSALADGARAATVMTLAPTPSSLLAAATAAHQQANVHAERAKQYRAAAHTATEKARALEIIAANDIKQGFPYQAGVAREKAQERRREAALNNAMAAREDALAAQCRAKAQQHMAQFQQMLGSSPQGRR